MWGSGRPRREFLHVDDLADACILLMQQYNADSIVNVGVGEDVSILELATIVKEVVGFHGNIQFDPSKPDGTPRKLLNVERVFNMGWRPKIGLREGISMTYQWYVDSLSGRENKPGRSLPLTQHNP